MSISLPSFKELPSTPLLNRHRSRSPLSSSSSSSCSSFSSPSGKIPSRKFFSPPNKKQHQKFPFWRPLKVAPLSSYREREEMIQAIINRQISNTYDKFYDNLGTADCWGKSDFQVTAVKTVRNLIFEGQELAQFNKKLKEDSEKKDERIKGLQADVETKAKENDELQKDYAIMEEQLNSAAGQISALEQTIDDLQEELIDAKQEADAAKQETEILKGRINAEAILLFEKWTKLIERSQKTSAGSA